MFLIFIFTNLRRLLAMGWNRHVTEFADEVAAAGSKGWELRHAEDVLCAATRSGQALATSSYSGELIFWHLETGQAYRFFFLRNSYLKRSLLNCFNYLIYYYYIDGIMW